MMGGWVKLEKSLRDDPRFLRMVRTLCAAQNVTQERISRPCAVTLLLGGLAQLWMYADTHVREDDTLDLGPDEINELIGIEGFVQLMPLDWIEILDANCVKLPEFHTHNGTDAKKKALTAKRVARHRIRNVTQESNARADVCNASELPDKTRLDKTRPEEEPRTVKPPPALKPVAQAAPAIDAGPIDRVFQHWREVHRHPQARLDDKRRKVIRSALKNYGEPELCEAISGYLNSPHHMGQNETGTVYDALELMLRDAQHIDAGRRFHAEPPRSDLSAQTRRIISTTENWTPPEMRHAGG